ncbi:MAG: hypothetical protein CO117_10360 [Flavobacteriaceae bacterium CG_4_9_14_3_um_filter_33_16]|nr:MAG: hypothetical protein CO117_10360 [Flavobacteriaceae bacterium CG_4_9_14_3_um_filter_33_16]
MRLIELTPIDSIDDTQGWQGYKQYYVKPAEIKRQNNLALIRSYDPKWRSYNYGWFDLSNLPKSSKYHKMPINSRSPFPYLKLSANLSLNEKEHGYTVEVIGVEPNYRGMGLAPSLYEAALTDLDMPIISDSKQTSAGSALWVKFFKNPKYLVKAINVDTGETGKAYLENNKLAGDLDISEHQMRFTLELA